MVVWQRRWWLALTMLALPALTSPRQLRARCAPEALQRCRRLGDKKFMIDGREHKLEYTEGVLFKASCSATPLGDAAWPRFPRPARFDTVALTGCAPPADSYAAALRALNVGVDAQLSLLALNDSNFEKAFDDLPPTVDTLVLQANSDVLVLDVALNEIRTLDLDRVRLKQFPPYLDVLKLKNTGLKELPADALNVVELSIYEENMTALAGATPRLRTAHIEAPLHALPPAPSLQDLTLQNAAPPPLAAGFVQASAQLRALTLRRLRSLQLPSEFLRGARSLHALTAVACNLTALPADLFAYTPQLNTIDLSENQIETLPEGLFSGLTQLQELSLSDNRLNTHSLTAAPPPATLTQLRLSRNPFGDLCPEGGISPLPPFPHLQALFLDHTNLTRVCADWPLLRGTIALNLDSNAVRVLACADLLAVTRDASLVSMHLDLTRNPVERIECSQKDYEFAINRRFNVSVYVFYDTDLACDCGSYWLSRVLRTRNDLKVHAPTTCIDQWLQCIGNDECGIATPKKVGLSIGGEEVERGELPWHAGVYRRNKQSYTQICGGSLVSSRLVISAAHCFWSDAMKQLPASDYAVSLGNVYRQWNDPRDRDVHTSQLSELKLPDIYLGSVSNFQADIALLLLQAPVTFQPHIRPICINFSSEFEDMQLQPGTLGKVSGWGLTAENGPASETLLAVQLPLVSVEECQAAAPPDFRKFITVDKLCAGYRNGTAALCRGDSGGGLAVPAADPAATVGGRARHYLRGVVSVAPHNHHLCNAYWLTVFTQLTAYEQFVFQNLDPV